MHQYNKDSYHNDASDRSDGGYGRYNRYYIGVFSTSFRNVPKQELNPVGPFRASSMAGYFDRKNGYAYFDRPLCSNKLFGQNVCPFCEDIQIGHTERTCRSPGSRDILEVQ